MIWPVRDLPQVKAWLKTSRSPRQCIKRLELATWMYMYTLWWSMSRAFVPWQTLIEITESNFNCEEFSWRGVAPTAAAERELLELAADEGREWIEAKEDDPEGLRELLMDAPWNFERPIGDHQRWLIELAGVSSWYYGC